MIHRMTTVTHHSMEIISPHLHHHRRQLAIRSIGPTTAVATALTSYITPTAIATAITTITSAGDPSRILIIRTMLARMATLLTPTRAEDVEKGMSLVEQQV